MTLLITNCKEFSSEIFILCLVSFKISRVQGLFYKDMSTLSDGKKCKVHAFWYEEDAFRVNSKARIKNHLSRIFVLRTQSQALFMEMLHFKKSTLQMNFILERQWIWRKIENSEIKWTGFVSRIGSPSSACDLHTGTNVQMKATDLEVHTLQ